MKHIDELAEPLDVVEDFIENEYVISGEYRPDSNDIEIQIINAKLCSYIIGMIVPGKRSLFMEAVMQTKCSRVNAEILSYRVSKKYVNCNMGLLKITVEVYDGEQLIAINQLTAYVRMVFSADGTLPQHTEVDLSGKVVLVIGGTKGIGAELVKKYTVQGAKVIATYYHDRAEAEKLSKLLSREKNPPELVQCDVSDGSACVTLSELIAEEYQVVDAMYLCAALAPHNIELYSETYSMFEAYINQSMRLFYYPFFTFLKLIAENGTVNVFSSVALLDKKTNYKMVEYICAKSILENLIEHTVYGAKRKDVRFRIIRAPKMLTEMNNTPTGRLEAMNPQVVAEKIYYANELLKEYKLYLNL